MDITGLAGATHVVRLAHLAVGQRQADRPSVILNVQPVADLQPIAEHKQRLTVQDIDCDERDQLLREWLRPVGVRAITDRGVEPTGLVIDPHHIIRGCLGGRIREFGA